MQINKLASAVVATGAQTHVVFNVDGARACSAPIQVVIADTATVMIQGRLDATFPWFDIKEYTESTAEEIVLLPHMRANVTAWTAGAVTVGLAANKSWA